MSRDITWTAEGAETALYVGRSIELAYAEGCEECWVIGGAQIYRMFLERADEFHITTVHTSGSGDVKYHNGFSSNVMTPGGEAHLALAFNPSHLEIVAPVLQGSVRARQVRRNDQARHNNKDGKIDNPPI